MSLTAHVNIHLCSIRESTASRSDDVQCSVPFIANPLLKIWSNSVILWQAYWSNTSIGIVIDRYQCNDNDTLVSFSLMSAQLQFPQHGAGTLRSSFCVWWEVARVAEWKRSTVWHYFQADNKMRANCLICKKAVNYSGNTANVFNHMKGGKK